MAKWFFVATDMIRRCLSSQLFALSSLLFWRWSPRYNGRTPTPLLYVGVLVLHSSSHASANIFSPSFHFLFLTQIPQVRLFAPDSEPNNSNTLLASQKHLNDDPPALRYCRDWCGLKTLRPSQMAGEQEGSTERWDLGAVGSLCNAADGPSWSPCGHCRNVSLYNYM